MGLVELKQRIEKKQARIAVIGLGYVGLPVAACFAQAGFDVMGVDIAKERVKRINAGESPIEGIEPGLQDLLSQVIGGGRLQATTDYTNLKDREVILIDVETPVDKNHQPRYEALRACLNSLGQVLADGALVIVESTISPGTMKKFVQPLLEKSSGKKLGSGFHLGNCPERVMPGKLLQNLRSLSRVVGGMTPETADCMVSLYRHIVDADLDPTDCITAELVKTVENAYRDVQIAFANEVALISEAVGGDVWKVRELVNKSPGRHMLLPGAGVGGHCIPKDPWLLASAVDGKQVPLRLIPAARTVNDGMPRHMVDLLKKALTEQGKQLKSARILVMGYSYLENSDDTRNSPSAVLVKELEKTGAQIVIHDPYVEQYKGDLLEMAKGCDAAVLMVKHDEYLVSSPDEFASKLNIQVLIDGRGLYAHRSKNDPMVYHGIGIGNAG